jgi:hypothetical protein
LLGQGLFTPLQGTYPETAQQSFLKSSNFVLGLLRTAQTAQVKTDLAIAALSS